jgi:ribosomal protein L37AE/L43A
MKTKKQIKNSMAKNLIITITILIIISTLSTAIFVTAQENEDIDCTGCHSIEMKRHRIPVKSCKACHSNDMTTLTMNDGTVIPLDESDPLCGQCHSQVYKAWLAGGHYTTDYECVACHNAHSEDKTTPTIWALSSYTWLFQTLAIIGAFVTAGLAALLSYHL